MPTTLTKPTDAKTAVKHLRVKVSTKSVEGERTVVFVASSPREDRDYESVDVESLRLPLKGGGQIAARDLTGDEAIALPFLLNHSFDVEDTIGSVRKAYLNEQGELVFEAGISARTKAQDMLLLLEEQHLDNAFSITMIDYMYDYEIDRIYDAEVVEVSLVFKGSNKEARLLQVKSLLKQGKSMSKDKATELAEKQAQLEALQKEIDAATAEAVVTPEVKPAPEVVPVENPAAAEIEADKPAVDTADKTEKPIAEDGEPVVQAGKSVEESTETNKTKSSKGDKTVSKEIATDAVAPKATAPAQPVVAKAIDKDVYRTKFVEQVLARRKGDLVTLQKLNKEVADLEGKSKALDFSDSAALFQSDVVSQDIQEAYTNLGLVGTLVNRIDIAGAEKWKRPVMTAGNGFRPVGDEETKQEDQPVFSALFVEPKEHALIVAWYDAVARRTPIAVYQQMVKYIATEYRKLEDRIVMSFAGTTTTGGDVFPATGLVPLLAADATRIVTVLDYSSAAVVAALGEAYGIVESDQAISIVASRRTWGRMAVAVDGEGRPLFTVVGNQVNAGALGTFNVVVSQEIEDDVAVVGAYQDYDLVTRGAMETLFSREATVGTLNLFTDDASAIRANVDIAGKPARLTSFALLDFGGLSS